jgi:hemoglobin
MTAYERIGGEAGVRRLVTRFYDLMDTLPEGRAARAVHPPSLESSAEKLFDYLTGWLGGPPLFVTKHGPPMLRRRHFPARIGPEEVEAWLVCFRRAFAETVADPSVAAVVMPQVEQLARHMQNRD